VQGTTAQAAWLREGAAEVVLCDFWHNTKGSDVVE
jgi:hypothetical protein